MELKTKNKSDDLSAGEKAERRHRRHQRDLILGPILAAPLVLFWGIVFVAAFSNNTSQITSEGPQRPRASTARLPTPKSSPENQGDDGKPLNISEVPPTPDVTEAAENKRSDLKISENDNSSASNFNAEIFAPPSNCRIAPGTENPVQQVLQRGDVLVDRSQPRLDRSGEKWYREEYLGCWLHHTQIRFSGQSYQVPERNEKSPTAISPQRSNKTRVESPSESKSSYIPGSCKDLKKMGLSRFQPGDPNYTSKRDRDGDGIACE